MQVRKIAQITDSHCGPAVLEMLLDAQGVQVSQSAIARAAGVVETIQKHGTRIDQLALATTRLAPHLSFWYKYHANLDDIDYILGRGFALAVEWQGIFYDTLEEQLSHGDYDAGHYSIVSHFDRQSSQLIIVDPYKEFADQDRIINSADFLERWWDSNEVYDEENDRRRIQTDEQLLFFITPETEVFPFDQGFKQYISLGDD